MGRLLNIATKVKVQAPMKTWVAINVTCEHGLQDDWRGQPGRRQVTVLSQEGWAAACHEIQQDLIWTTRRANLYTSNINLENATGKILRIGSVELLITQETAPCERMNVSHPKLMHALNKNWRGGVCCEVLHEGQLLVGDEIEICNA